MIAKIVFIDEERKVEKTFHEYEKFYVWLASYVNEDEKCRLALFLAAAHDLDRECEKANCLQFKQLEGFTFMLGNLSLARKMSRKWFVIESLINANNRAELTVLKGMMSSTNPEQESISYRARKIKSEMPGFKMIPSLFFPPSMRIYLGQFCHKSINPTTTNGQYSERSLHSS